MTIMYRIAGERLTEAEYKKKYPGEFKQREENRKFAAKLGRVKAGACTPRDETDWRRENGGKGRYCGQLGEHVNDERAYFPTKAAMVEAAKHRGLKQENTHEEI